MSATGKLQPGDAGFTLLEMLVVVGITALGAGIAFPAIEKMQSGAEFRVAATTTELVLRSARAEALRTGTPVQLALLGDTGLVAGAMLPAQLPASVRISGPSDGIRFFADGSASGGTLTLTGRLRTLRIAVSRDTGAIGTAP